MLRLLIIYFAHCKTKYCRENQKFLDLFKSAFPKQYNKIRFPDSSGIGIKPASREGTERVLGAH